jgi:phosphoglycolate phosphatase-like HAD superfamily hydrolase
MVMLKNQYKGAIMNQRIIILDIDHTISNSFWRDYMIGGVPWDEYHSSSKDDKPFPKVLKLVNDLAAMDYFIVAVTGRNEKFRSLTIYWILNNQIHIDELLMRPDDDFRKNSELKVALISKRFNNNYRDIHFAIEDNEDACLAYKELGITTLQIRNIGE